MDTQGVQVDGVRAVDHDIATGVWPDMREHGWETDVWPDLYRQVMAADIPVPAGPRPRTRARVPRGWDSKA